MGDYWWCLSTSFNNLCQKDASMLILEFYIVFKRLGLIIGSLFVNLYVCKNKETMKKAFGLAYLLQGFFFLGFVLSNQLIIGIITLLCMRIAGALSSL